MLPAKAGWSSLTTLIPVDSPGSAGRHLWIPTPPAASCSPLLPTRRSRWAAVYAARRGKNTKHLGTGRECCLESVMWPVCPTLPGMEMIPRDLTAHSMLTPPHSPGSFAHSADSETRVKAPSFTSSRFLGVEPSPEVALAVSVCSPLGSFDNNYHWLPCPEEGLNGSSGHL